MSIHLLKMQFLQKSKGDKAMAYEELLEISEFRKYTYEDYMCNQPMRDGKEIRNFFDSLDDEEEQKGVSK